MALWDDGPGRAHVSGAPLARTLLLPGPSQRPALCAVVVTYFFAGFFGALIVCLELVGSYPRPPPVFLILSYDRS